MRRCVIALAAWVAASAAAAQPPTPARPVEAPSPRAAAPAPLPPVDLPRPVATQHVGVFNGRRTTYTATVEALDVPDAAGAPAARLVAISYVAQGAGADRPIIFAFNGGPISPSHIIHMGLLGPRRLALPDDVAADPSTFRVVDNAYSPLDAADLVFFDPAETGFSRMAPGRAFQRDFASVPGDARELTGLVLAWRKAHGREASPFYLVGESYGTIRAAEAAGQLLKAGAPPAGVALLGQAVNLVEYVQRPANIVSYAVSLPTLAALGWAHDKAERRGRSFERFMADAQAYGGGEYLSVLFQGRRAPAARREAVARELQAFTGLPAAVFLEHDLKISKTFYQRNLLPGRVLGTEDGRYVGAAGGPDPFSPVVKAMDAAFQRYLREDLAAPAGLGAYSTANPASGGFNGWDWGPSRSPFGDFPYGQALSEVFRARPDFRVVVGDGVYDTQTTIGAQDYLLADSDWPPERVRTYHYLGGHMAYTVEASARAINDDLRRLVTKAW